MKVRVKCIDDTINPEFIIETARYYKSWVKKGEIYTVYDVVNNDGIVEAYILEELENEPVYQKLLGREQEPAFRIDRFEIISYEEEEEENEEVEHIFEVFLN
jgi:hypothetical protein